MIFGNDLLVTRKAVLNDLEYVKKLADRHKRELGFVLRPALQYSINSSELFVADWESNLVVGFVHYRHRRDGQTTLYNLAVDPDFRNSGIGSQLVRSLISEASDLHQNKVFLKCPVDLPSNKFYEKLGFSFVRSETGKRRALNIWQIDTNVQFSAQ